MELLLGDNPFIGVSHLSQEKTRKQAAGTVLENKVRVIEAAIKGGATGFTFSTEKSNLELLNYLDQNRADLLKSMNYYVLVPYGQSYVREANLAGSAGLIKSTLNKILRRRSTVFDVLKACFTLRPEAFAGPFIEAELAPYLEILPRQRIKAILLHEIVTELIIAFNLVNLYKSLKLHVNNRIGVGFGLETRNIFALCARITKGEYDPDYVMTPMNPLGYQMAPSKEMAESSVRQLSKRTKIIAINVLASGAVSLEEAMNYLLNYRENLYAVTSASLNPQRIHQNFTKLSRLFSDQMGT